MYPSWTVRAAASLILGLILLGFGCSKGDEAPQIVTVDGRIEKIESASDGGGRLMLRYYNEKKRQEQVGVILVTLETEIMIRGALAGLADLREGESVRAEVLIDKKQTPELHVALKIYTDRVGSGGEGR